MQTLLVRFHNVRSATCRISRTIRIVNSMAFDGLYPIVTHAFNFVGRGALGLFQAGDGDPKN